MVTLDQVRASNAQVHHHLQPNLVAVFVGATSGIGEYTLKAFAKQASQPRVYLIGRSQEAADRIKADCHRLNPQGEFIFIQKDVSLLENVDEVCREIKEREKTINLLVLSQGTLLFGPDSGDGLPYAVAVAYHSRARFMINLLPLLRNATGLRRVVTVLAGTKQGPLDLNDHLGRQIPLKNGRGHLTSLTTFNLEAMAQKAPEVSFVHVYPGFVKSGIAREARGVLMTAFCFVGSIINIFRAMDNDECGERHLFLGTSRKYPSKIDGQNNGIELPEGVKVAVGSDGAIGSGVYNIDEHGESASKQTEDLLADMRKQGYVDKAWELTVEDFKRITGSESI